METKTFEEMLEKAGIKSGVCLLCGETWTPKALEMGVCIDCREEAKETAKLNENKKDWASNY